MIRKEFTFNLYNTHFYGKYFDPENIKAVVVLVHGMGEHSERYENHVIPILNKNSYAVITYDQFGHGKTEGKRGHNPGFEALLDCVDFIIEKSSHLFKGKPIFLYGHSMGGNVVINYTLKRKGKLKGVIVTSPLLRLAFDPPEWKLLAGKLLQKFIPSITMNSELETEAISRDINEVEKYKNDPLVHSKISPNYSVTLFKTGEWAIQNANQLKTPMLLLHGTGDRITNWKASQEFATNSKQNVELQLYEGAYHELHNELNKKEVLEKITDWIDKRLT